MRLRRVKRFYMIRPAICYWLKNIAPGKARLGLRFLPGLFFTLPVTCGVRRIEPILLSRPIHRRATFRLANAGFGEGDAFRELAGDQECNLLGDALGAGVDRCVCEGRHIV